MTIFPDMSRDYGGREESNKTRVKTVGAGVQTKTTNHNALNYRSRDYQAILFAYSEKYVYVTDIENLVNVGSFSNAQ